MSAQHTPGPWASNSADSFELGVYGSGYRIAKMTGGEINRDVANARLMAAAPDLLETLSKTLKRIEEALAYGYLPAGTEQELETQAAEIRAAIAKATGAT
jgi:hypothetical protein